MPDPGEKKEAKMRQYKKTVKDYKKENFREKEKKSLTKSIGTAGPKVRPDGADITGYLEYFKCLQVS